TIDYNQTYDLTITAITVSTGATGVNPSWGTLYQLQAPSTANVGAARLAYNDTEHCGQSGSAYYSGSCTTPTAFANITFPNVKFNEAGTLFINNRTTTVAEFTVSPIYELNVQLSKTTAVYSP